MQENQIFRKTAYLHLLCKPLFFKVQHTLIFLFKMWILMTCTGMTLILVASLISSTLLGIQHQIACWMNEGILVFSTEKQSVGTGVSTKTLGFGYGCGEAGCTCCRCRAGLWVPVLFWQFPARPHLGVLLLNDLKNSGHSAYASSYMKYVCAHIHTSKIQLLVTCILLARVTTFSSLMVFVFLSVKKGQGHKTGQDVPTPCHLFDMVCGRAEIPMNVCQGSFMMM